jgi:hypothetical protein
MRAAAPREPHSSLRELHAVRGRAGVSRSCGARPGQVPICSIVPSCCGREPLTFAWAPKYPATHTPAGLHLDQRSGNVTGAPGFLGEVGAPPAPCA